MFTVQWFLVHMSCCTQVFISKINCSLFRHYTRYFWPWTRLNRVYRLSNYLISGSFTAKIWMKAFASFPLSKEVIKFYLTLLDRLLAFWALGQNTLRLRCVMDILDCHAQCGCTIASKWPIFRRTSRPRSNIGLKWCLTALRHIHS